MIRLALVSILALVFAPQDEPKKPPTPAVAPQETAIAKKDAFRIEFALDGTFEPSDRHPVMVKVETYQGELVVAKIAAHGAKVKKDEVILQVDAAKWKESVEAADLALVSARTQLDRTTQEQKLAETSDVNTLDRLEREARDSAERFKYFTEVDMGMSLREQEQGVASYEDSVADQKEELDQLEKMYKSEELTNATADIVVKRARRNLERSKVRLEMAKVRLERSRTHGIPQQLDSYKVAARDAAHQLESWKVMAPMAKADRAAGLTRAGVAVKQCEEQVEKLKRDEKALTVAAAADGTVWYGAFDQGGWQGVEEAARTLKAGEKVRPMQVLMTLVPDKLSVRTVIPETRLGDFSVDAPVLVSAIAYPDLSLPGKSSAVSVIGARRGDGFDLRIDLTGSDPRLVPGLRAKVHIVGAEIKDAIVIPSVAIADDSGKKTVRTIVGSKVTVQPVTVGRSNGTLTEIKAGLREGEEVLLK